MADECCEENVPVITKFIRNLYRSIVVALIRRCLGRNFQLRGRGGELMVRCGVYRVGTLWAIPTLKSCRVWKMLRHAKRIRIFLTVPECWSGGAVYYLNQQIEGFEKGCMSLVVSPSGFMRCLTVRMYDGKDMVESFQIGGLSALGSINGKVDDIVVSTVVAWHDVVGQARIDDKGIAELMRQILGVKHSLGCRLLYLLHDYYCVCPRLFLVGDDGRYCHSEFNAERCNNCCSRDVNCVEQIAAGTDVKKWRLTMEEFLSEAEEIRAFCVDTVWRMKSVFPRLSYTLVPHPEPTAIRRQPVVSYETMRVGLIGNIGLNKGVNEVASLAAWLEARRANERLTIIGNWCSARPCPGNVETTGCYRQEELPELVERTGVNVILFSSTFPETFSYVMHEIIQLGLPVASFDIGAQKDCAKDYAKGRIISSLEPSIIWQTICELFEDVRQNQVPIKHR